MSDTGHERLPTQGEMAAWRAFLRAHARVTRCLEGDLIAEQRLSLAAYDVLVHLADSRDHRMRMTELAEAVLLSRSGVTRLVDRLERAGLVHRARLDADGRAVHAVLTERGMRRLRAASSTHLDGLVRYFLAPADGMEINALARACERLADGGVPEPVVQSPQV